MSRLILICLVAVAPAWAQQKPAPATPGLVIIPPRNDREYILGPSQPAAVAPPKESSPNPPAPIAYPASAVNPAGPWTRLAGGVALSITNSGSIQALFKDTSDRFFKKNNAKELGFGISGLLDFYLPGQPGGLRFRAGVYRFEITPSTKLSSTHTASQLESSENLVRLSAVYRVPLAAEGMGLLIWAGAGAEMLYVFATTRPKDGADLKGSQLNGSLGYNPILALGSDIPFTSFTDFSLEANYLPWRGYLLLAGLRTAL